MCFVEGEVGLVGDAVRCRSIDNCLVELEDGIKVLFFLCPFHQELRHFLQIGVKPYAQETLLAFDVLKKLFACHIVSS